MECVRRNNYLGGPIVIVLTTCSLALIAVPVCWIFFSLWIIHPIYSPIESLLFRPYLSTTMTLVCGYNIVVPILVTPGFRYTHILLSLIRMHHHDFSCRLAGATFGLCSSC